MTSTSYQLFEQAMRERKQIVCTYLRTNREVCPHILGHRHGKEVALTYQFAGTNFDGAEVTGDWKCLYLSKVRNPTLRDGPWYGGSDHSQGQTCVLDVDLDVNPDSPYDPKRRLDRNEPNQQSGNRSPWIRRDSSSRNAWIRALHAISTIVANPTRLLVDVIEGKAATHPDVPALLSEMQALTYAELTEQTNRYARWALEHLAKGDVVCLLMLNRPEYVALWLGITLAGGVVALINTNLRGAALARAIATASPRHVIVAAELFEALHQAVPDPTSFQIWTDQEPDVTRYSGESLSLSERRQVNIHDTALLIYTSGTTGLPKAAKVTHYRILQWSLWFAGLANIRASDRMYNCLPLYHSVGGVVAICSVLVAGGSVVIAEKFSASRFWPEIVKWECTLFQYIGELCRYLVNAPPSAEEHRHRLRLACGNGLRGDIWTKFKERFGIPHIIEFYAASEGTFSLFNIENEPGAIGHVPAFLAPRFPAVIVRYDEEREQPYRDENGRCVRCAPNEVGEALGRISAKADNPESRFEGYVNAAETERKILRDVFHEGDVWYRTGDLMRMDERGFIYFVDRVGDTFRWKGENVSSLEVAEVLSSCPGVLDVVVYGVAVPGADGRAGMAAVTAGPAFDFPTFHSVAKERLPAYARPVFVRLCSVIDMTETFKPKKQSLAAEGFDPQTIADPLYVEDRAADTYIPLDHAIFRKIGRGEFRF